jgi:autotransporter-associated beta strand protein
VIKTRQLKIRHRRSALRIALCAGTFGCFALASSPLHATELTYVGPAGSNWSSSNNWSPTQLPAAGDVADLFTAEQINYDISAASAVPLQALQIAAGNTASPAILTLQSGTLLQVTGGIYLGGSLTGANATNTSTGPGQIQQLAGQVDLGTTGLLAVDPTSSYQLGNSATLTSGNQQLAGLFTQSGSASNTLAAGATLINSGTYSIQDTATLSTDTLSNTGTFNQFGGSIAGATQPVMNFNNSGTYSYTAGTFSGYLTNNLSATVSINGSNIPFSQGILDNGLMTVTAATGNYAGPISGTGSLLFNGSQNVTLSGSNPFIGQSQISGGTLTLASPLGSALLGPVTVNTGSVLIFAADAQLSSTTPLTIAGGIVNLANCNQSIATLTLTSGQFNLSGSGYLSSGPERIAGTFTQLDTSTNNLTSAAALGISGNYLLQSAASLFSDSISNSGVFNQSGGTVAGSSGPGTNFNNSGQYLLSAGAFTGQLNNANAAAFNISGGTFNGSLNNSTGASTRLAGGTINGSVTNLPGSLFLFSSGNLTGSFLNSGLFNTSGGTSSANVTNKANATLLYTGGTFTGSLNNNSGALVTLNNTSAGMTIPFTSGILNNGQITITGMTGSYAGPLSGSGSLIFNGSQTVTLTGSGTFNGSTSITSGNLTLASAAGPALVGNVTVGAAAALTFGSDSQLSANTLLTLNGGLVNLNGYNESLGAITLNAGQISQPGSLPLNVSTGLVTVGKGSSSISSGLRLGAAGIFNLSNNAALAINGPITAPSTTASTSLTLTGGGGTLTLYGNSLLSSIDIKQGILQLAEGGSLGGINSSTTIEPAGTLSLNGQILTIGDLSGSGAVALGTGGSASLYITSSAAGSTFFGSITGNGSLVKFGAGTFTFTGNDSAAGSLTLNTGTLTVSNSASLASNSITTATSTILNLSGMITNNPFVTANGTVNFGANPAAGFLTRSVAGLSISSNAIAGNGQVNIAPAALRSSRTLLVCPSLTFAGSTNAWLGQLDLSSNDMIVPNGNLATLTNQVKTGFNSAAGGNWKGNGITSSTAAVDPTHLTALGIIQNTSAQGQALYGTAAPLGTFDNYNPAATAVLIKYTYVGDGNLDGKIDGSDYSLIDNGYLNHLTGWFNGDFNYDGIVDGSDYTLIDNAYNTQASTLAAIDAQATASLTSNLSPPTSVPEPSMLALLSLSSIYCKRRSRRGHNSHTKDSPAGQSHLAFHSPHAPEEP